MIDIRLWRTLKGEFKEKKNFTELLYDIETLTISRFKEFGIAEKIFWRIQKKKFIEIIPIFGGGLPQKLV